MSKIIALRDNYGKGKNAIGVKFVEIDAVKSDSVLLDMREKREGHGKVVKNR